MKPAKRKSLSWLISIFILIAFCNCASRALAQDEASELEQRITELEKEAEKLSAEMAALNSKDPDDPEIVDLQLRRNTISTALLGYRVELANLKG